MKHLLLTILIAICSLAASAQIPYFFGVPVDKSPSDFIYGLRCEGVQVDLLSDDGRKAIYKFNVDKPLVKIIIDYDRDLIYCVTVKNFEDSDTSREMAYNFLLARCMEDNGQHGYVRHEYIGSSTFAIKKTTDEGDIFIKKEDPAEHNQWHYTAVLEMWNVVNSKKLSE